MPLTPLQRPVSWNKTYLKQSLPRVFLQHKNFYHLKEKNENTLSVEALF